MSLKAWFWSADGKSVIACLVNSAGQEEWVTLSAEDARKRFGVCHAA